MEVLATLSHQDDYGPVFSFSAHGISKGAAAAEFAQKKLSALSPLIENQNETLATLPSITTTTYVIVIVVYTS